MCFPTYPLPFLPVHQRHGLEAGAVLDLSGHGLWALDAALGYVEGNVHAGRDGPRHQADGKLPQELQGRVLAKKTMNKSNNSLDIMTTMYCSADISIEVMLTS